MHHADLAMYGAKASEGSNLTFFEPSAARPAAIEKPEAA